MPNTIKNIVNSDQNKVQSMQWLPECLDDAILNVVGDGFFKQGTETSKILSTLANFLKVDIVDYNKYIGIPDMFRKAVLYEAVFYPQTTKDEDKLFPYLRKWLTYEWRSMIAILVLAKSLNIPITIEPFFHGTPDTDTKMENILRKRLPKSKPWSFLNSNALGWEWDKGVVFLLNDKVIAISSPSTIIVPAADAWKILSENGYRDMLPWIKPFIYANLVIDPSTGIEIKNDPQTGKKLRVAPTTTIEVDAADPVAVINQASIDWSSTPFNLVFPDNPIAYLCRHLELYRKELLEKASGHSVEFDRLLKKPTPNSNSSGLIYEFISDLCAVNNLNLNDLGINDSSEMIFKRWFNMKGILAFAAPQIMNTTGTISLSPIIGNTNVVATYSNTIIVNTHDVPDPSKLIFGSMSIQDLINVDDVTLGALEQQLSVKIIRSHELFAEKVSYTCSASGSHVVTPQDAPVFNSLIAQGIGLKLSFNAIPNTTFPSYIAQIVADIAISSGGNTTVLSKTYDMDEILLCIDGSIAGADNIIFLDCEMENVTGHKLENTILLLGNGNDLIVQELVSGKHDLKALSLQHNRHFILSRDLFADELFYAYYEVVDRAPTVGDANWLLPTVTRGDNKHYRVKKPETAVYAELTKAVTSVTTVFTLNTLGEYACGAQIEIAIPGLPTPFTKVYTNYELNVCIDCSVANMTDTLYIDNEQYSNIGHSADKIFVFGDNFEPFTESLQVMAIDQNVRNSIKNRGKAVNLNIMFAKDILESELSIAHFKSKKTYAGEWYAYGDNPLYQIELPLISDNKYFIEAINKSNRKTFAESYRINDKDGDLKAEFIFEIPMTAFTANQILKREYSRNSGEITLYYDCQVRGDDNTYFIDYEKTYDGFDHKHIKVVFGAEGLDSMAQKNNCMTLYEFAHERKVHLNKRDEKDKANGIKTICDEPLNSSIYSATLARLLKDRNIVFNDEIWLGKAHFSFLKSDISQAEGGKEAISDAVDGSKVICDEWKLDPNAIRKFRASFWVPLPLSSAGFELFKTQKKGYSVNVETPEDAAAFSDRTKIKTTLVIEMNNTQDIELTKEYAADNGTAVRIDRGAMPLCGIWPKQYIKGWKSYYLFSYHGHDGHTFEDASETTIYPPEEARTVKFYESERTFYREMTKIPEYLKFFHTYDPNTILGYVPLNTTELSVNPKSTSLRYDVAFDFGTSSSVIKKIMRNSNEEIVDPNFAELQCSDLGSSAVFYIPRVQTGNSSTGFADVYTESFIPHNSKIFPPYFQSLLRDHLKDDNPGPRHNILVAFIYYRQMLDDANDRLDRNIIGEIDDSLKWDESNSNKQERFKAFCRQIARYIILDTLIHGYHRFKVWASYPSAKIEGDKQIILLKDELVTVVEDDLDDFSGVLTQVTALKNHILEGKEDPDVFFKTETEGIAAAHSFNHDDSAKFRCIIDIGAGTTDYLVYRADSKGNYHSRDSSVKYGSRDILIKYFKKLGMPDESRNIKLHDMFLSAYFANKMRARDEANSDKELYGKEIEKVDKARIYWGFKTWMPHTHHDESILEYLFSKGTSDTGLFDLNKSPVTFGELVPTAFLAAKPNGADGGKIKSSENQLTTVLALGVAALVYFAGMLAKSLEKEGVVFDDKRAVFQFAGNGSKILGWFHQKGPHIDDKNFQKLLEIIFDRGLKGVETRQTIDASCIVECIPYSRRPKMEAVTGMLHPNTTLLSRLKHKKKENGFLSGGQYTYNGKKYGPYELITTGMLPKKEDELNPTGSNPYMEVAQSLSLDLLKHFIESFNYAVDEVYSEKNPGSGEAELSGSCRLMKIAFDDNSEKLKENIDEFVEQYLEKLGSGVRNDLIPFLFLQVQAFQEHLVKETWHMIKK